MARRLTLAIRNFAQISKADLSFGDLTVLVGAQGTGKSLALQWFKAALDGRRVVRALTDAGHVKTKSGTLVDLIFGTGMGGAWRPGATRIRLNDLNVAPETLSRLGQSSERVFFVPAHRSMLIQDGWAAPFQKLSTETPVVARMFSQTLFDLFTGRHTGTLFPQDRVLKREYREKIDAAVFHGGTIAMVEDAQHARRLRMSHGGMQLPFMTWTAGQREFTPMLLGLYHLLPSRKKGKQEHIDWVVIEEPEMGLHPQAITVVMLLVLDLLWRGYRVVLSTHSPHVLATMWMLDRLAAHKADPRHLCEAFDVTPSGAMLAVAKSALGKDYRVHLMAFGDDGKVQSMDISSLDPGADDERLSGWGGLTGYTSKIAETVRKAVNEAGA